ncbi:sigma-70 family RNA polymerase sigma factor [Sorangium sp. So ce406]|uniref:sigma-70 family RNA polymerase sigma factor n=1 Tax=Sorangium sp. So ce406 TaxID=3133311 RepID=UPI003F5C261B
MTDGVLSVEELIARAQAGDQAAVERLFQWYSPLLEDWASLRLGKRHPGIARPSDIAQEAAIRAFRAISTFKGTTQAEWLSWLRSIVETCTNQAFRDAARKKRDRAAETPLEERELPAQQPSPSQAAAVEEQWRQVFGLIFELPEEQRKVIWLYHLRDLRLSEVARSMGKTDAAAAGLLRRGLEALRARLTGEPAPSLEGGSLRAIQAQEDATAALLAYVRRRDAGERVDAGAFIAEHPSCAGELRHMIAWMERIESLRPANLGELGEEENGEH